MEPAASSLESYVREGIEAYRQKSEFPFSGTLSLTIYPTLTVFTESRPAPERAIKGWVHHVLGHYQLSQLKSTKGLFTLQF